MNESETRAELIDPMLQSVGWSSGGDIKVHREDPIDAGEITISGKRKKSLIADYILSYRNRKLAVVEAKSDELEVSEGIAQAKLYAQKLNLETSYSTNGREIYQICHKTGIEGLVDKFPTPDELWSKTFDTSNEWRDKFSSVPFEDIGGTKIPRYFGEIAVNNVMDAIADNKKRVLLTLATGTGKTFIAFQIAWKLFKSKWNVQLDGKRSPRILFLADRNVLADQAIQEFSPFQDNALVRINPNQISKTGKVPMNGAVFFTIFQTFMSGPEGKPYFGQYDEDFFDLVIIDECHRGGANDESSWRDILNHFKSAVHLGLTATPKRNVNVDTYDYFGEPVYIYSLKQGIQDGFLTPFKVNRFQSSLDEYTYSEEDKVTAGEVLKDKKYTKDEFNRTIVIVARERALVRELLDNINQSEKTLVFCVDQEHAALVRDLINQEKTSTHPEYCVRVTANDHQIGDDYLNLFKDNDREIPTILTTSRKLTTGVDALNVRNIVLFRPIKNMIEFKQIIGRGTRLYQGKHYFTIHDFVDAYHMFNDDEWDGEPMDPIINPKTPVPPIIDPDDPIIDPDKPKTPKVRIKLGDGKDREIFITKESYFYLDGNPVTVEQFINKLFDTLKLPEFMKSEEELRRLWSNPITRLELLKSLDDHGFSKDDLIQLK
jgi:type I restriction enzyme, R subunit